MDMSKVTRVQIVMVGLAAGAGCSSHEAETTYKPAGATQGQEATPPEPEAVQGRPTDAQILNILAKVDTAEIAQAQIAREKASDPRVREFASHMIQQHSDSKKQVAALVQDEHLTPADSTTAERLQSQATDMLGTLNNTKPGSFDATYMNAQVKQHQQVLNLINEKLIPAAQNPAVKGQLQAARSMVQQHLNEAQELASSLTALAY